MMSAIYAKQGPTTTLDNMSEVAAGLTISCRQFQHPFGAARFGRGDFNRKTSFNRLAKILHELIHAVAVGSAARNGGDFGPKAPLLSLMHDNLYLHYWISTSDCLADTRQIQVLQNAP